MYTMGINAKIRQNIIPNNQFRKKGQLIIDWNVC